MQDAESDHSACQAQQLLLAALGQVRLLFSRSTPPGVKSREISVK